MNCEELRNSVTPIEAVQWIRDGNFSDLLADGRLINAETAIREVLDDTPDGKAIREIIATALRSRRKRQAQKECFAAQTEPLEINWGEMQGRLEDGFTGYFPDGPPADRLYDITVKNEFDHQVMTWDTCGQEVYIPGNSAIKFSNIARCFIWDWTTKTYVGLAMPYQGIDYIRVGPLKFDLQPDLETEQPGEIILRAKNYMNTYLQVFSWRENGNVGAIHYLPPNSESRLGSIHRGHSLAFVTKDGTLIREYTTTTDPGVSEDCVEIRPQYRTYSGVDTTQSGSLWAKSIESYNIGTGDFTVLATSKPAGTGTLVSRKGLPGGSWMEGGFILTLEEGHKIKFATDDGTAFFEAVTKTGADQLYDGMEHCVAGVRTGNKLHIYLDGEEVETIYQGPGKPPLNINTRHPLTIGTTEEKMPCIQFSGSIYNAGYWNRPLSREEMMQASFEIIAPSLRSGLLGYWRLDYTYEDDSDYKNTLSPQGSIPFISDCSLRWKYGEKKYFYLRCGNTQNDMLPDGQVMNQTLSFYIAPKTPALYVTLYDNAVYFNEQSQASLRLYDPSGKCYSNAADTEELYISIGKNGLEKAAIQAPLEGTWKLSLSVSPKVPFSLQVNTLPDADNEEEIQRIMTDTIRALHTPRDADDDTLIINEAYSGICSLLTAVEAEETPGTDGIVFRGGLCVISIFKKIIIFNPLIALAVIAAVAVVTVTTVLVVNAVKKSKAQAVTKLKKSLLYLDAGGNPSAQSKFNDWLHNSNSRTSLKNYMNQRFSTHKTFIGPQVTKANVSNELKGSYDMVSISGQGYFTAVKGYDPAENILDYNDYYLNKIANNKVFFLYVSQACAVEFSIGVQLAAKGAKAVFGFQNILYASGSDPNLIEEYLGKTVFVAEKEFLGGASAKAAVRSAKTAFANAKTELLSKHPDKEFLAALIEYTGNNLIGPGYSPQFGNPDCKIV